MATLTITLSGSSVVNGSKSYTVSDADTQIVINCMIDKFSPKDDQGNITTPLTPAQALLSWVTNYFVGPTIGEVKNWRTAQAIKTISIPPVSFG